MTTRRRRTGTSRGRSGYRPRRTRRRVSPASTLGTATGVAVAVGLIGLLGGLPWWGWLLLVAAGVAVLGIWAVSRGRGGDAEPDPGAEPVPPADGRGATGT
jgi:peptidoglycan/LPS O-acetylase OafA/YrhL